MMSSNVCCPQLKDLQFSIRKDKKTKLNVIVLEFIKEDNKPI